jgi:hypothetical protein
VRLFLLKCLFIERSCLIIAYIYKIENLINHKIYIGKTELINPEERWREHVREAGREGRKHRAIYAAMRKYGIENFSFEVLEETQCPNEREQDYIQEYNSYHNGYNETLGGDGRSYLVLPEKEIIAFYLKCKNLRKTAEYFHHDVRTIRQLLYKYNIQRFNSGESLKKPVVQIDKNTGEIIQIFPSATEAEKSVPTGQHINQVCKGSRKTAGGYKWAYAIMEEDID